ncbi:flavodoxin [Halotalea alkalilenta]|uniref:Flavodoxin n=1 Tax=Halotalea alkalilenta TaxID=376489 RepID=A0A172YA98_9GAMM|nr:flavodoxin [Halotalea alkalilenta]ANF56140.1 flavodoxin [Halotalea alkalilenta]
MEILLGFDSLSGNTREVAELIKAEAERLGHRVTQVYVTIESLADVLPEPFPAERFDLYLLGSWTANSGRTPPEMKEFIAELFERVGKPSHVAVFGTGETQWGEEFYCGAVKRMAKFFASAYPRLEIEQMPHGDKDRAAINEWTRGVITSRTAESHEHHRHHLA